MRATLEDLIWGIFSLEEFEGTEFVFRESYFGALVGQDVYYSSISN